MNPISLIHIRVSRFSISCVRFGYLCLLRHFYILSVLLNFLAKLFITFFCFPFNIRRVCTDVPYFIHDISNLCFLSLLFDQFSKLFIYLIDIFKKPTFSWSFPVICLLYHWFLLLPLFPSFYLLPVQFALCFLAS